MGYFNYGFGYLFKYFIHFQSSYYYFYCIFANFNNNLDFEIYMVKFDFMYRHFVNFIKNFIHLNLINLEFIYDFLKYNYFHHL